MKEFEWDTLSECDGREGKPVYIVHEGKVYDVSGSKLWKGGLHMRRHRAATDLTTDFQAAPHGTEVLERYPQVGVLKEKKEAGTDVVMPEALRNLLVRYPMFRRHPHPMTVHFPIVFMISVAVFNLLYLVTGVKSFETTALHCLGAGVLFTPLVIVTGYYTWWLNYLSKPLRAVTLKKRYSIAMWILALDALLLRVGFPELVDSFRITSLVYFLLVFSLPVMVTVIGWYGAQLTFPIERE